MSREYKPIPPAPTLVPGDRVRFVHESDGPYGAVRTVRSVRHGGPNHGMVEVDGLPGLFAPHLFVKQKAEVDGKS